MTTDPQPAKPSAETDYFGTQHLLGDLRKRTISSGIVKAAAQGLQFVLTLGYNMIMARLLTPEEFGLVAMVMVVIGFLQIFRDMGLSTATIQRPDITHAQVSNLFWLNVGVSGIISLLIAASAPLIALFYHEPRLADIALALSAYYLLNGLAGQHMALLNRQMRFVVISTIEVGSMAAGFLVGVGMALSHHGYWSLVAATMVQQAVRLLAVWSVSRWRPQLPVREVGTRPLAKFGANLTVSGFIFSTSHGSDGLLIGRVYGSEAVGLYTRAAALLLRPLEQLVAPIYAVIVPTLSRLHGEPERYRRFFLQVFEALALTVFFFAGLVLPLARPLTVAILGSGWVAAAAIFAGLSLCAIYAPLSAATSWLYSSQGRGQDMIKLSIVEATITILSVLAGLPFGPIGVAIAFSAAGIAVKLPVTFHIAGRSGPVDSRALWTAFLRQAPVFFVVGAATWGLAHATGHLSPVRQLFACAPAGLAVGAAAIWALPSSRQSAKQLFKALAEMRQR